MGAVRCQIECYSGCALRVSGGVVKAECGMWKVMKREPQNRW